MVGTDPEPRAPRTPGLVRNWAGNIRFSTSDIRRPTTVAELQDLVRHSSRLRAVGTAHSFNDIADTTGTLVSTQSLDLPIEVLGSRGVAVVPGGATYAEVAAALHDRGWALHNMGSLPHITIAGACASGTHGSGVQNGCLATAVVGVELVRADGELVEVHRGHPDFAGMVVSLGALGVVTRLWLSIEPAFTMSQEVLLDLPLHDVARHVQEVLSSAYSVSILSAFGRPDRIDSVWRKHRHGEGGGPLGAPPAGWPWGGRVATSDINPVTGLDASAATVQRGLPGPWHHRLPHFRADFTPSVGDELQSEFFLPLECAGPALEQLGHRSQEFAHALQVFEMRAVAADDLWLSPFYERSSVAVHATWVSDFSVVRAALTALEAILAEYEPRPHWAKVFLGANGPELIDTYPEGPRFRDLAGRMDPERRFVNNYLTRLGMHP